MRFIASLPAGSQTWLLNSPLAPHLDAFAAHLANGGYSAQTTRNHFLGVAHFARWMTQCALPVSLLDERSVQQFLGIHLSHCSCPPPALSDPSKHRSSLGHLMVVLRRQGVVAEVPPAIGPIPDELRRFDEHTCMAKAASNARFHFGIQRSVRFERGKRSTLNLMPDHPCCPTARVSR